MKGIVLAAGAGTRLHPVTLVVSKQLLPVYDKPMIYYPLSTLMLRNLLRDGSQLGLSISYAVQQQPRGLADAFIVGQQFIGADNVALILGDNIFYGHGLSEMLTKAASRREGATIFGYVVSEPERYGVVELDVSGKALSIEEKPQKPKSTMR
jgi:glucose-1-phosphate thymidylyltransferase